MEIAGTRHHELNKKRKSLLVNCGFTNLLNVIVTEHFRLPRFGFLIVREDSQLEDGSPAGADNLLQDGVEGLDTLKYNFSH